MVAEKWNRTVEGNRLVVAKEQRGGGLHLFLKQSSVRRQATLAFDHERLRRSNPSGRPYHSRPQLRVRISE